MQLALDSLDRLVELVEERGGRVRATEAAEHLFAVRRAPEGLARSLLEPLVEEDARLVWRGGFVALGEAPSPLLEDACFVVFDLETTGLSVASARICEIGAVRVERLELAGSFETLVAPGVPLPAPIGRLTGLSEDVLRRAPRIATALRRFSAFAGDRTLVAHNARFDVSFVDRELERLTGKRLSAAAIDTVSLARTLLRGRVERTSLASLSFFFGTSVSPCHRALPDAQATAEILLALIGLAQERGARTVAELEELAAPRPRRVHGKRRLVRDAPERPGVYLFRDRLDQVLYVGKARNLRERLRSYFQSDRQRPSLEAALGALERVEWRIVGSELAASLEEAELIRRLRPPANRRAPRPEQYAYLRRQGDTVVAGKLVSPYGPLRNPGHARRAARALGGCTAEEFDRLLDGGPLPRLRARMHWLSGALHYEDAARLRDRIASLEQVIEQLRRLAHLRTLELLLLAPGVEAGWREAFFLAGGRLAHRRPIPPGADAEGAIRAGTILAREQTAGGPSCRPEHLDELLIVGGFLGRPPPELRIRPLGDPPATLARTARTVSSDRDRPV